MSMESSPEKISELLGHGNSLSEAEIGDLSQALYTLAIDGIAVPKHLMRHDARAYRYYGYTLDAIPAALDRLGPDRERVVVGLLSRFEQAIRDHHDQVNSRVPGAPLDNHIVQRYFDVAFFLPAAKPKTEESVVQVADFLRSEKSEVHENASEMLLGAPYFPVIIDRLFENVATHGIRQWPNRQARVLASFASVPEVRARLMSCFHSEKENLRYLAAMTFPCLGENAGYDAELELFAMAEDDENRFQSAALDGLHAICPRSDRLRQLALRLIRSDKYWVRGNAITCLGTFHDRESIDALLTALLDEGGHDFDNAGNAAKLLEKAPLDPHHVLPPLMATLETLLEREDRAYENQAGFRADVQTLANISKTAAEEQGKSAEGLGVMSYVSPETLFAVARVLGHLGPAARPALPLIEKCCARPYVSGASNSEEWKKVLEAITAQ